MTISYTGGLNFTGPESGDTNWAATEDAAKTKISAHDHTGGGKGAQIATAAIADNAVSAPKVRLANDAALRARNAAGSADLNLIKADSNNLAELPTTTRFSSAQSVTSSGAFTIASNLVRLSAAGATAVTVNVPASSQSGQPVLVTNVGAGTFTVTITGQESGYTTATIGVSGSMMLVPISTTTWAVIPGGGCTLA